MADETAAPAETAPTEQAPDKTAKQMVGEAAEEATRRYKLKINGQERDYDEKTIIAMAQKGFASDEKFRKASEKEKRIEQILTRAKGDPDVLLRELLELDPIEYSKNKLKEQLEEMSLDPKEKELRQLKKEIEKLRDVEKKRKEESDKVENDKAVQMYIKKFDKEIPEGLERVGLPVNSQTIQLAAKIMMENLEEGIDIPMDIVAEFVKEQFSGGFKKFITTSDKAKLIDLLGDDLVDELIKAKSSRGKVKIKQALPTGEQPSKKKNEFSTREEFDEFVKNWAKT